MTQSEEYPSFPKIPRLNREIVITEKIDGTACMVEVSGDPATVRAGSKNHWITPEDDHMGFARWVADNAEGLALLGQGRHWGEWFGAGIGKRHYGLTTSRRWALYNTGRWNLTNVPNVPGLVTVPVLYQGSVYDEGTEEYPALDMSQAVEYALNRLRFNGSYATGQYFDNPEGIVVYHTALDGYFKVTLRKDEEPKALIEKARAERAARQEATAG